MMGSGIAIYLWALAVICSPADPDEPYRRKQGLFYAEFLRRSEPALKHAAAEQLLRSQKIKDQDAGDIITRIKRTLKSDNTLGRNWDGGGEVVVRPLRTTLFLS
jgi:hypothetical protein